MFHKMAMPRFRQYALPFGFAWLIIAIAVYFSHTEAWRYMDTTGVAHTTGLKLRVLRPVDISVATYRFSGLGIEYVVFAQRSPGDSATLLLLPHIPTFILTLLIAITFIGWGAYDFWKERRDSYRQLNGLCSGCGYDLRAHT